MDLALTTQKQPALTPSLPTSVNPTTSTTHSFSFSELDLGFSDDNGASTSTETKKTKSRISIKLIENGKTRSILKVLARIHAEHPVNREWIKFIFFELEITSSARICSISKYSFQDNDFYVIAEYSHIVYPQMIIQACPTSSETFDTNRCKLTNSHLGPALKALDDSTRNPRILISHEELVLQYSGNSTLQIRCD